MKTQFKVGDKVFLPDVRFNQRGAFQSSAVKYAYAAKQPYLVVCQVYGRTSVELDLTITETTGSSRFPTSCLTPYPDEIYEINKIREEIGL